jgi:hypothetical protein
MPNIADDKGYYIYRNKLLEADVQALQKKILHYQQQSKRFRRAWMELKAKEENKCQMDT